MAFERLETDEKLDAPVKAARDMDAQMMVGCTGFVVASFVTYLLSIWPFFAFSKIEHTSTLVLDCAVGLIPAAVFGAIATRKAGLAGATGFVAGGVATAVFIYLDIQRVFVLTEMDRVLPPEYPRSIMGLIPLTWLIVFVAIAALFLPKNELLEKDDSPS